MTRPVAGVQVQLAATGTGNALFQPAGPTDASGVATGTLTSTVAETKTITATIEQGAVPEQATATFSPGPPGQLAFVQQPANAAADEMLRPAVTGYYERLEPRRPPGTSNTP